MSNLSAGINMGLVSVSAAPSNSTSSGVQLSYCVNTPLVSVCYTPPPPGQNITATSTIVGFGYQK